MAKKVQVKTEYTPQKNTDVIWTSQSLAAALGADVPQNIEISSVAIDTRTLQPNSLFIGIKGENHNGNFFAIDAIDKGAALCIVDELPEGAQKYSNLIIKVDSSLEALNKLAIYSRNRLKGKVIGITGSVGKTSIREMIKIALENQGKTYASSKNYNNHYGLPLTLANISEDTEYAVLEMGMSGAGELSQLTKIAKPHVAIVSNIGPVHIEYFSSVAGIAAAKAEIFDGVVKGGDVIVNADNDYTPILIAKAKELKLNIHTFGEKNKAEMRLLDVKQDDSKLEVQAEYNRKDVFYTLNTVARHQALNSIIALLACKLAGAELEYSAFALRDFSSLKGRGLVHHIPRKNIIIIDESYNATPMSMKAALATLASFKNKGRLIAVLGNMIGRDEETHTELFVDVANNSVSKVYAVGNMMKALYEKLPQDMQGGYAEDAKGIVDKLHADLQKGDVIVVKGSNYMKMDTIVEKLLNA